MSHDSCPTINHTMRPRLAAITFSSMSLSAFAIRFLPPAVPTSRSNYGRPVEFPLPTLFVLLGLKFDSGLGYRDFVASLTFNPQLLHHLGLTRAPSYSLLHKALKRLDTHLLHQMYQLLARKKPEDCRGLVRVLSLYWR